MAGALAARLALFLPVAIVVGAVLPAFGVWPAGAARAVVALAAAGLAYGCLGAIHRASPGRLAAVLAIEFGGAVALGVGAVAVVAQSGGVVALLGVATLVELAQCGAALTLWRLASPSDRLRWPTPQAARSILARAWPFAASGWVANAQTRIAPLMVGWLAGTGEVASFGVAVRLETAARRAPYAAFGAALPVFAGEATAGRSQQVRSRFERGLRWFAAVAAATLVAFARPIVRVTYGAAFAAAAWPLAIAGAGLVPALVNSSREVFLYATGREREALQWGTTALAVQAVACILLIPRFGASGAMAALAAGELAVWLPLGAAARGAACFRRAGSPRRYGAIACASSR